MFDPPEQVPYAQIPYSVVDSDAHRALAEKVARESLVLLRNQDGLLPLSTDIASIAVIGPNADQAAALLGNYNGTPSKAITPLQGIRNMLAGGRTVVYTAQGCDLAEGIPLLQLVPSTCLRPDDAVARVYGMPLADAEDQWRKTLGRRGWLRRLPSGRAMWGVVWSSLSLLVIVGFVRARLRLRRFRRAEEEADEGGYPYE